MEAEEIETREYVDEWTNEVATTTWRSSPDRYRNSKLLEVCAEVHAKVQQKHGVHDWNVDTETLVREAIKKAYGVEFSPTAFNRTLPEVVAASEARRAQRTAKSVEKKKMAAASASELKLANAWLAGKNAGKTDKQIHDDLQKSGVDKSLLAKFFPTLK